MSDPCLTSTHTVDFPPLAISDPSSLTDLTPFLLPTTGTPVTVHGAVGSSVVDYQAWPIEGLAGISEIDSTGTVLAYDSAITASEAARVVWKTADAALVDLSGIFLSQATASDASSGRFAPLPRGLAGVWPSNAAYYAIAAISTFSFSHTPGQHEIMQIDLAAYCDIPGQPASFATVYGLLGLQGWVLALSTTGSARGGRSKARIVG